MLVSINDRLGVLCAFLSAPAAGQEIEPTPPERILSDLYRVERLGDPDEGEAEKLMGLLKRFLGVR